jgi:hypothetical protein
MASDMANMSYCRFYNTYYDFSDCLTALQEGEELSDKESTYAQRLYEAAKDYVEEFELRNEDM